MAYKRLKMDGDIAQLESACLEAGGHELDPHYPTTDYTILFISNRNMISETY